MRFWFCTFNYSQTFAFFYPRKYFSVQLDETITKDDEKRNKTSWTCLFGLYAKRIKSLVIYDENNA